MQAKIHFLHKDGKELPSSLKKQHIDFGKITIRYYQESPILFVGLATEKRELEAVKHLAANIRRAAVKEGFIGLDLPLDQFQASDEEIGAFFEGWYLAGYQFNKYKKNSTNMKVELNYHPDYQPLDQLGKTVAEAVATARDLCNEPARVLTPSHYADRLVQMFRATKVEVKIFSGEELQKHFPATNRVGEGSAHSPRVAILTLANGGSQSIGLVGKGVTFDTGGISLKTGSDIVDMKMDMGGSAAVVGAVKLAADLDLPVNVTAILPLTENIPGSRAYLPSDVIVYKDGTTVEVGNTDAEGRLILADGLLYAQSIGADVIIDIATLTGSIGNALGLKVAGIFCNQSLSIETCQEISRKSGDSIWPMPLVDDYASLLASPTADLKNVGKSPYGGAVIAAEFLKHFISPKHKWYHIDMANTVTPFEENGYYSKGAAGFGVRLLAELIKQEEGI
ncbi:leucyl aminopeptidase family protein [Gracilibacillus alcaliphilus]|uniref:leucyl aminopeptidase family protein n=1 Tax=Gracilibacillus alcaliphilus TaxID=1401441 RepID=UPI00195A03DE|nr:leucyl aminopeptidase family protein [Gracilibacillus alcaliphilus]MBM7676297.1 leucyl aminopeptidase [Gracilibacillus alcaliphilus]